MFNKYKDITIFEIENGWLVKVDEPEDPGKPNQVAYFSKYYPDKDALLDGLKELI